MKAKLAQEFFKEYGFRDDPGLLMKGKVLYLRPTLATISFLFLDDTNQGLTKTRVLAGNSVALCKTSHHGYTFPTKEVVPREIGGWWDLAEQTHRKMLANTIRNDILPTLRARHNPHTLLQYARATAEANVIDSRAWEGSACLSVYFLDQKGYTTCKEGFWASALLGPQPPWMAELRDRMTELDALVQRSMEEAREYLIRRATEVFVGGKLEALLPVEYKPE